MTITTPFKFELPPKVFISYSHADREFVAKLAADLAKNRIVVWWDEWEIKVGESLIKKIEDGISSSSYLAVVLSPNSVNSAWVQEELRAALVRQLKEKRTVVLPILLNDCQIPLFLEEKKYANFKFEYNTGFAELIRSIEPPNTESHGRDEGGEYLNDYAFEWFTTGNRFGLNIEITSHSSKLPYSVNCKITAIATEPLSKRLQQYHDAGFPWATPGMLLIQLEDTIADKSPVILIQGDLVAKKNLAILDPKYGTGVDIQIVARRLGTDPGSDVLYEWGTTFMSLARRHREGVHNALSPNEIMKFEQWRIKNPIIRHET